MRLKHLALFFFCLSPLFANELILLKDHDSALAARIHMVRHAKTSVSAAYFIFNDDEAGLMGLHEFRAAARRGLKVRLIIDAQWNKVSLSLIRHLRAEGVAVRCYHPFRWSRPFWISRRMHDKLMIADGKQLITGGRNIENAYFGLSERNYVDRDVFIEGQTAKDAQVYFDQLWESSHVDVPDLSGVWPKRVREASQKLDRFDAVIKEHVNDLNHWKKNVYQPKSIKFIYDPVAEKRKKPGIRRDLLDLLRTTQKEIVIETPYLVVSRKLLKMIDEARIRDIKIRILTNSLHSTDNLYPQAGYKKRKKQLLKRGVELWEYKGPESLHAKSAVIDGKTVIIGSYNVDPRSERLNTEVAVIIEDKDIAQQVLKSMDIHLESAWQIDKNGKPKAPEKHPRIGFFKWLKLKFIGLILPLIWDQL